MDKIGRNSAFFGEKINLKMSTGLPFVGKTRFSSSDKPGLSCKRGA
jgi:hypothetical protein